MEIGVAPESLWQGTGIT